MADTNDGSLSGTEQATLDRVRKYSEFMDEAIPIPGTDYHVGIDPILSIAPVSGDLAGAVLSLYIVAEAARLGVSRGTLGRMLFNIGVDTVAGSIPVLGTLVDAGWKANTMNADLLEETLDTRGDDETA